MPINVVGGRSSRGRVSVLSDKFIATARCSGAGEVTCTVAPLPRLSRFLFQHKSWPLPRLLKLLLLLISSTTARGWMYLGAGILLATLLLRLVPSSATEAVPKVLQSSWVLWLTYAYIVVRVAMYTRRHIASWHGAEHMAIAAYLRRGSTDLATIMAESPIDPHCGGRFFLPLLGATMATRFVAPHLPLHYLVTSLLLWEATLWVDTLVGWDKVPIAAQASVLLQRYITTREPGERELLTAQRAMESLAATPH